MKGSSQALAALVRRAGVSSTVADGVSESVQPSPDPLDQLKKLAELREMDAITPLEFDEHKKMLLAKLARDAAK